MLNSLRTPEGMSIAAASFPWRRWRLADEKADEATVPLKGETEEGPVPDPLAERDRQIAGLTADLKRIQAEFENFKKRTEREWTERSKLATQRLITGMLAVLDSFDKALEDASRNCDSQSLTKGLEQLHKQLLQTLQREGLKEIRTEGKFDPFMHEAVLREERDDADDGKILDVYQKGYILNSKAIRPAKVKVAKRKEPEEIHDKQHHETESQEK